MTLTLRELETLRNSLQLSLAVRKGNPAVAREHKALLEKAVLEINRRVKDEEQ